jgi:hypothetical protein
MTGESARLYGSLSNFVNIHERIRNGTFAMTTGAQIKAEAVSAGLLLLSPAGRSGVSLKGGRLLLSRP